MEIGTLCRVIVDYPYSAMLLAGDIVKIVNINRIETDRITVQSIKGGRNWHIRKKNVQVLIRNKGKKKDII